MLGIKKAGHGQADGKGEEHHPKPSTNLGVAGSLNLLEHPFFLDLAVESMAAAVERMGELLHNLEV
jgi:hypothetical protein